MDRLERLIRFLRFVVSMVLLLTLLLSLLLAAFDAHAVGQVNKLQREVWRGKCPGTDRAIEGRSAKEAAYECASDFPTSGYYYAECVRYVTWTYQLTDPPPIEGDRQTVFYTRTGALAMSCRDFPLASPSSSSTGTLDYSSISLIKSIEQACPNNSTGVGGVCQCDFGFSPKADGSCQQYTCPPSGSYSAITQPDQKVGNAGDGLCKQGCGYAPSSWKVGQDGQIWATWPYKSTGSFCGGNKSVDTGVDTGEKNTGEPAPVPCGQNQCPGTVNGATICVPCKAQQEQGPSTSASAPGDGSSSPSGTKTTETKTECNGVTCTTTTTTRDGNGNVVGTEQKQDKQESFCKENPQSALCKQSSFGGTCSAVTCDGDAIQCAIAQDQYRRNCQWFDDPKSAQLAQTGEGYMNGELQPTGHPAKDASSQSVNFASVIDTTDRLGGACPVDVAVSVSGKELVLPFSSMCSKLQLVGGLMVGFCMFVASLIVFRS